MALEDGVLAVVSWWKDHVTAGAGRRKCPPQELKRIPRDRCYYMVNCFCAKLIDGWSRSWGKSILANNNDVKNLLIERLGSVGWWNCLLGGTTTHQPYHFLLKRHLPIIRGVRPYFLGKTRNCVFPNATEKQYPAYCRFSGNLQGRVMISIMESA